jgi:hypothetical protein
MDTGEPAGSQQRIIAAVFFHVYDRHISFVFEQWLKLINNFCHNGKIYWNSYSYRRRKSKFIFIFILQVAQIWI